MLKEIHLQSTRHEERIDITHEVAKWIAEIKCKNGIGVVYTPHTTAAVTINENADPDVVRDILYGLEKIVPLSGYHHGEGNSPAHIKSSLIGCSESILIEDGKLMLGTWQGIYPPTPKTLDLPGDEGVGRTRRSLDEGG